MVMTMNDEELSQGRRENQENVNAFLVTSLMPPFAEGSEDVDDRPPVGQLMLMEWVLCSAWSDETGHTYYACATSPNLPMHHARGLMHEYISEE